MLGAASKGELGLQWLAGADNIYVCTHTHTSSILLSLCCWSILMLLEARASDSTSPSIIQAYVDHIQS